MKKKFVSVKFKNKFTKKKRQWGDEIVLNVISKILSLKILKIKKGKKGGLQFHRKKNECGILLKGKLLVRYSPNGKVLKTDLICHGFQRISVGESIN